MKRFDQIWALDFEFNGSSDADLKPTGERPHPVALVCTEIRSGRTLRFWEDELAQMGQPPFPIGKGTLALAFFASAEWSCFLALGWPLPENAVDLYVECRCLTNPLSPPLGRSLVGFSAYYGLPHLSLTEKGGMVERILQGAPWSADDKAAILDYCASDVAGAVALFKALEPQIAASDRRLQQALFRGRYTQCIAHMEHDGIPIDMPLKEQIEEHGDSIRRGVIAEVNEQCGVFDGMVFKYDLFEDFLARHTFPWPRDRETNKLCLQEKTFSAQAKIYPDIQPIHEARANLSKLRSSGMAVGGDGRNRTLLGPFSTLTGRNAPRAGPFVFGPSRWIRSLIKPPPGQSLAYLDWSSQEVYVAAGLSGDKNLIAACQSGDIYLSFAVSAGLAPPGATKKSHPQARSLAKTLVLGIGYGMSAFGLSQRAGLLQAEAQRLLNIYDLTYATFRNWQADIVNQAHLHRTLTTPLGWEYRGQCAPFIKTNTARNWPMQAAGADLLRLACVNALSAGIKVIAPVHDAVLIEAPTEDIEEAILKMKTFMEDASRDLFGIACPVEHLNKDGSSIAVNYPDRYHDAGGREMFERVLRRLAAAQGDLPAPRACTCSHGGHPGPFFNILQ